MSTFKPDADLGDQRPPSRAEVALGCLVAIGAMLLAGWGITVAVDRLSARHAEAPAAVAHSAPDSRVVVADKAAAAYRASAPKEPAPLAYGCSGRQDPIVCAAATTRMIGSWWPKAVAGDVEAARSVAECLETGCSGAVIPDRTAACAWRLVIVAAPSGKATDQDTAMTRSTCGVLDEPARAVAVGQAQARVASFR